MYIITYIYKKSFMDLTRSSSSRMFVGCPSQRGTNFGGLHNNALVLTSMHIYVYIYICIYIDTYIYIYVYR